MLEKIINNIECLTKNLKNNLVTFLWKHLNLCFIPIFHSTIAPCKTLHVCKWLVTPPGRDLPKLIIYHQKDHGVTHRLACSVWNFPSGETPWIVIPTPQMVKTIWLNWRVSHPISICEPCILIVRGEAKILTWGVSKYGNIRCIFYIQNSIGGRILLFIERFGLVKLTSP